MRNWLKAVFTALAGIFVVTILLWIGTLSPAICSKLWIAALATAVLAGILFVGYMGNGKKNQ